MCSYDFKNVRRQSGLVLGAVCLLASLAAGSQAQAARDGGGGGEPRHAELPNFHRVSERLYRGAQPREGGLRKLSALGVNTVINLREEDARERVEAREAREAGLRYFNVPLGRLGRPDDEKVERLLALLDAPENGVVFVHCAKGEDRTGTIVALYRISRGGWTSARAKKEANEHGMKFWQHAMKDYIHDYARDRATASPPAQSEQQSERKKAARQ